MSECSPTGSPLNLSTLSHTGQKLISVGEFGMSEEETQCNMCCGSFEQEETRDDSSCSKDLQHILHCVPLSAVVFSF
jgi:hypothetical protein